MIMIMIILSIMKEFRMLITAFWLWMTWQIMKWTLHQKIQLPTKIVLIPTATIQKLIIMKNNNNKKGKELDGLSTTVAWANECIVFVHCLKIKKIKLIKINRK